MTWIKTVSPKDSDEVRQAVEAQRALYPPEYAASGHASDTDDAASVVASHSLIPEALLHAFSTFGALLSPGLPLSRRQHEMITTVVSAANRCKY